MIKLEKELSLLSQANKNPEANKYLIPKLYGSIDALKWVLGFDYINKEVLSNIPGNLYVIVFVTKKVNLSSTFKLSFRDQ